MEVIHTAIGFGRMAWDPVYYSSILIQDENKYCGNLKIGETKSPITSTLHFSAFSENPQTVFFRSHLISAEFGNETNFS